MAVSRAFYTGTEMIMQAFDNMDNPYYSVWSGRDLLFQNNDSDVSKGRNLLMEMLTAAEQNNNTDLLSIKFHPKQEGKYITDKTPVVGTLVVRVVALPGMNAGVSGVNESGNIPYPIWKTITGLAELPTQIQTSLAGFDERLKALEQQQDEPQDAPDMIGRIAGLMENPVIMGLITKILPAIFPAAMPQPNMQVAGVNSFAAVENESVSSDQTEQLPAISEADYIKLDNALARLIPHCNVADDLSLLADLAEQNPIMFKMLLTQLRSK